jgi:hypothetical protein
MPIMYDIIIICGIIKILIYFNNVVIFNFTHFMLQFIFFSLWHLGVMTFSMSNLTMGTIVIQNNPFLKLALCMSWIMISHKITSPFNEHECDNVIYVLCILSCTLSSG